MTFNAQNSDPGYTFTLDGDWVPTLAFNRVAGRTGLVMTLDGDPLVRDSEDHKGLIELTADQVAQRLDKK